MSKPRVDPTFGISSVDVLILTERHPACRWREAQPGSCKERENLAGDAKGKGPSGPNLGKLRRTHCEHMFSALHLDVGHCSMQAACLKGAKDRDRGEPRGSSPPTPPYVRVRIRRFEKLR